MGFEGGLGGFWWMGEGEGIVDGWKGNWEMGWVGR